MQEEMTMAKHLSGTYTSNGVDIQLQVDDYTGKWEAEFNGRTWSYETLDKLKASLDRQTKKSRVEVEVHAVKVIQYRGWGIGDTTVQRGVLTGIHSGTGNVLAAWDNRGKTVKEQITRDSGTTFVAGDTSDEQLAEYNRLLRLRIETAKNITEWEKKFKIEPLKAVEQAIIARLGDAE
jgi:hypothetical protein